VAGSWTSVTDLISSGSDSEKMPKAEVKPECAQYVIESQHTRPLFDALGICRLQYMELGFEEENYEKLFHVSERIWNLTRIISNREIKNFGRRLDYPPARFYQEPIPSGPNEGYFLSKADLEVLLDEYYRARGWDENGIPTAETLERLGLGELVKSHHN
jgi:aldehyde:ferredoxin oxidoreductase